jgi:hypothetical protein
MVASLSDRGYVEYRVNMWCKPVGHVLFCFDLETAQLYWLDHNKTGERVKVSSNVSTDKLTAKIKEYEHTYYNR